MYRFRKKSDAQPPSRAVAPPPNSPPGIDAVSPPTSDFRTSLINPSFYPSEDGKRGSHSASGYQRAYTG
ncbi:hypothetical protein CALVIDRAFT_535994 [Calocera viscosa TUFC12733]|uniref:Uncharacterized protein n=1 Tax=Calocera viscosa (strain TUFC12733) TaxID=1330018 RepID=A0A167NNC2_CALVF|nr:hypothetical protein CALVIDRAFT_535994 [Calocera viscosa TUFC12733]